MAIRNDSYINFICKWALIFTISIIVFGCASFNGKVHYQNGSRYIPMLKEYISKDSSLHQELKSTYSYALDEWLSLMKAEGEK